MRQSNSSALRPTGQGDEKAVEPDHRPLVFASVPAAAKWANLPIYMIRTAIAEGSLRHVRRGRSILVTSTALLEWLGEGR